MQSKAAGKWMFFSFLFILVGVGSIFPVTDNDVWWHLRTGEHIWTHHHIPTEDIFSYTIAGKPWVSFEWLSQLFFYALYLAGGLAGLTIFKALVAALIFFILLRGASSSDELVAWVLMGLGFIVMRDGLRERPQLFTYLLAAVFLLVLRSGKKSAVLFLPALMAVWVNLHGPAAIIGLGLVVIYGIFSEKIDLRTKVFCIAASVAAMFVNPHTYHIFTYFHTFFREGFNRLILEYQPPRVSVVYLPYFLLLGLSLLSIFRARPHADRLTLLFSGIASLMAIRNIPVFVVLSVPIIAETLSFLTRPWERLNGRLKIVPALGGSFLLLVFGYGAGRFDVLGRYRFGIGDAHRARHAVEFVRQSGIKGPMFNDYDLGGYLIGKLYPKQKVFVDGRLVEYGARFVERSFYYWKPDVWDSLEDRYRFVCAIVPMERYYAASYLDNRKDWILVYWDDGALVYLKDVPENAAIIRRFGYHALRPNSPSQNYLKDIPPAKAKEEISRALYFAPQSKRARQLKMLFQRG